MANITIPTQKQAVPLRAFVGFYQNLPSKRIMKKYFLSSKLKTLSFQIYEINLTL